MTATVETVSEQFDLANILPSDRALARSITLSEADGGKMSIIFFLIKGVARD